MNRVDKDRPRSFPAGPMDQPRRREIPLTDSENGEYSSPENEAAVSEGWPISTLDPLELTAVLASDVKAENPPALFLSRATIEPQQTKRAARQFSARAWKAGWQSWLALNANELTWTALVGAGVILTALFADR